MVGDKKVPKKESEWNKKDIEIAQLNTKAMNNFFVHQGKISTTEYPHMAKEIQEKLAIIREEINKVKESKINMLTFNYEMFKIKSKESIKEMCNQFTKIVNGLKGFRKMYPNMKMSRK